MAKTQLEACMLAVDFLILPPAKLMGYLLIRLREPEHVDCKENLFKALTQVTSAASVDSNPRSVDPQSATLTIQLLCST